MNHAAISLAVCVNIRWYMALDDEDAIASGRELDAMVAESGEVIFGYRNGNLFVQVGLFALGSLIVAASGLLVAFGLFSSQSTRAMPLWLSIPIGLISLGVAVGFAAAAFALSHTVENEKVVLTPAYASWVDRNGVERVRCLLGDTSYVEEYAVLIRRRQFVCRVQFGDARIIFSDKIDCYSELKAFFLARRNQNSLSRRET